MEVGVQLSKRVVGLFDAAIWQLHTLCATSATSFVFAHFEIMLSMTFISY